jgi:CDP-glucose 4,6-dehydratase
LEHGRRSLEGLEVTFLDGCYLGKRVLVTGHTGFKGSWLTLFLSSLGAKVTGIGLDPLPRASHWDDLHLEIEDHRLDVRDECSLERAFVGAQPEVVFHLAAQALVRESYDSPLDTWSTNVMGTANVLEASRKTSSVRAVVVVTTDKCYENREWPWGYRETDQIGGHDPYSASKAAAEILCASYRRSFLNGSLGPLLATARAGNVVGGGDWAQDRLVPDIVRSLQSRAALRVRHPTATRPWQHVLDGLYGYLLLGQRLLAGERAFADAWNFGPDETSDATVEAVLVAFRRHLPALEWIASPAEANRKETDTLRLDSSKARRRLGWRPRWSLERTVEATAEWYAAYMAQRPVLSRRQLAAYLMDHASTLG